MATFFRRLFGPKKPCQTRKDSITGRNKTLNTKSKEVVWFPNLFVISRNYRLSIPLEKQSALHPSKRRRELVVEIVSDSTKKFLKRRGMGILLASFRMTEPAHLPGRQ
ncbi:unnamed protein product [Heligmosomoides polygyrus]|uniref:SHSP domain-containing protein n=1 Tax=Heligmosomoides polygyrus TaxID=6339 RepID=A0A183F4G1_HELPZ|nr:unnamed protein product [Heligmosomoides polygyrus]